RHYSQEKLKDAGESDATRERHVEFYVALAERAEPALVGWEQRTWVTRLNAERENFLAAHTWCGRSEKFAAAGLRLVASLHGYFIDCGPLALGRRLAVEALARTGAQHRDLARCRVLGAAGKFSYFMGRYDESRDYAEACLTLAREIDDESREAEALRYLGMAESAHGNTTMGGVRLQEALAVLRRQGVKTGLAQVLNSLAGNEYDDGNFGQAELFYQEALVLDREQGNLSCTAINLGNLTEISLRLGMGDRARQMATEGMAIVEQIGRKRAGVALLDTVATLAASFGELELAARLCGANAALAEEMGLRAAPPDDFTASLLAKAREGLGAAAFAAAESAGRMLTYDEAIAEARAWLERR